MNDRRGGSGSARGWGDPWSWLTAACTVAAALMAATSPLAAQTGEGGVPFDFTFGPQEDGHLGAVLRGDRFYVLSRTDPANWEPGRAVLLSPFAGLLVDAGWSSAPDALNNASLSFRPALGVSRVRQRTIENPVTGQADTVPTTTGPWLHLFGELRQRFGKIRVEPESEPEAVNQAMLGLGAQLRWTGFSAAYANLLASAGLDTGRDDEAPTLSLTYYTVRSTSSDVPLLPRGVTADALQAAISMDVTLPLLCTSQVVAPPSDPDDPFADVAGAVITCPLGVTGDLLGTVPLGGTGLESGLLLDVGMYLNTGSDLKPMVRYRSGEEHGLSYDRQLVLGVLWDLAQ